MAETADLARIKRNVSRLVEMGAPEADIDAYIAEEGTTIEAVRDFKLPSASTGSAGGAEGYVQPEMPEGMVLDPKTGRVIDTRQEAEALRRQGGFMQKASDWAGQIASGVPFLGEYLDEASGALAQATGGNAELTEERARAKLEAYRKENPKTATALRVAGGVAGSIPMAVAAGPAVAAAAPASLLGQVAAGGIAGAGLGGLEGAISGYGAGTDEDSRSREALQRGVIGGALGGTIGAAVPAASKVAKPAVQRVLDWISTNKRAAQHGLSQPSHQILTRAMDADGSLTGTGARNIALAGDDAMLADAGPNARTLLDTAIQRSGKAGTLAREAVEDRAAKANQDIARSLDTTLGRPQGVKATETAIRQGSAAGRSNAYGAAYNSPIDYADPKALQLEELLERVPGDVVRNANRLMQLGGDKSRQILANIADDGSVTYKVMPDVRQLDYITRALNQAAEAGDGAGALGGQTAMGRAYQNLARDIRTTLRDLVPEYGIALDTAAEPIAARQALVFGSKILSPSVKRDEVAELVKGITLPERAQAMHGLRSQIDDMLANVKRAVSDGNMDAREAVKAVKELSSRANREKVSLLIGKSQADKLFNDMDRAAMALDLRAGVQQNSKTYARLSMDDTIKQQSEAGPLGTLLSGEPLNATKKFAQILVGRTPADQAAKADKIYEEIVKALTEKRGKDAAKLLQDLQYIAGSSQQNAQRAGEIANEGALLLGLPAYQTGTQATRN